MLRKEDIRDLDLVSPDELRSDGSSVFNFRDHVPVIDVVSRVVRLNISEFESLSGSDEPLEDGNVVFISGSSAADGTYFVQSVTASGTFVVSGTVPDSTGGTVAFRHGAGSRILGIAPGLTRSSGSNLHDVLREFDAGISSSLGQGHRALNQLVHAVAENRVEEIVRTGNRVDAIIVWTDASKSEKIREENFQYDGSRVVAVTASQYGIDGLTVVERLVDEFSYTGTRIDFVTGTLT